MTPEHKALIRAVRDHALKNYGRSGWDIVIECWSDEDVSNAIGNATTAKRAICKVRAVVAPVADYRSDIESTAF